jgi:glycosyltransferase 2 family protein
VYRKLKFSFVKRVLKWLLGVLVLVFVGRHIARTWVDLKSHGRSIHLDPFWAVVSVGLYLAGLILCGIYYSDLLRASTSPTPRIPAVRAYLISHLGKYVPGKAMVVVMRVGLVAPYGARPATAAFATVYETLVMMAAGALLAVIGYALTPGLVLPIPLGYFGTRHVPIVAVALVLEVVFLVVVTPGVFRKLSRLISLPFPGVGPDALPALSSGLLARGMFWTGAGWVFLGLSQVAILQALLPSSVPLALWPAVVASVALATVAGFVIGVAPGGLGVREWVLWTALAALGSSIDQDIAVVAALALRLSWVVGEILAALMLAVIRPRRPRTSS